MPTIANLIRFGAFEVDLRSGELRKNGMRIHLAEQPLQVLALLLEHPGEVVTREELRQCLWSSDTFVDFEHGLNAAVKRLREALGDSADNPRFIETIPRRGYRFIASASELDSPLLPAQPLEGRTWRWTPYRAGAITGVALLLVGMAVLGRLIYRRFGAPPNSGSNQTVAVLPFADLSPQRDQQYFSDGLADELLTALTKIPGLRVSARTSSFQFKDKNEDLKTIGQKLKVQSILEGGVRKDGKRVRITVQLVNASDGFHIWSERYDRELDDIFVVQDEIARSVAESLKVSLLKEKAGGRSAQNRSVEAYNAYLQGRYFFERSTREDTEKAVVYYTQALKLNPDFAQAWAGLAEARSHQADSGFLPVEEGYGKAREAVDRALVLDGNLAKAHECMGWIKMAHDWDWAGADASFQRALVLEPGNATVLWKAAKLVGSLGRHKEALALNRQSVELDPLSPYAYLMLGNAAYFADQPDEAAGAFKKALELNPQFPYAHAYLGRVYLVQGRPREAMSEMQREPDPAWRQFGLALAHHALGEKKEADAALQDYIAKYQADWAYQIAEAYAFRGESDLAFQWLERAYNQRDAGLSEVKGDPLLKNLKHDPRYAAFMKEKMNLPQ